MIVEIYYHMFLHVVRHFLLQDQHHLMLFESFLPVLKKQIKNFKTMHANVVT